MAETVEISPFEISPYFGEETPVEAWLFASAPFTTPSGKFVADGHIESDKNFHRKVPVTINGDGKITVGSFSGDNAVEANIANNRNLGGTYSLYLVDENGTNLKTLYKNIYISDIYETATSWAVLKSYNRAARLPYKPNYPTYDQLLEHLNGFEIADLADDVVYGRSKLSKAPADLDEPTAVGINEAFVEAALNNEYLADYESLEAAGGVIEQDVDYKFVIAEDMEVNNTQTTSDNMQLQFEGAAKIGAKDGAVLTIGNFLSPGSRKLFEGDGDVILGRVMTPEIKLTHFLGNEASITDGAAVKKAFKQAFESINGAGGGTIHLPLANWTTDANSAQGGALDDYDGFLDIPDHTTIIGAGSNSTASAGTVIKLIENNSHIFRITQNARDIHFKNLTFDLTGTSNSRAVIIRDTDSQGTIGKVSFEDVGFYNGKCGFDADPQTLEGLDIHLLSFKKCTFLGQTEAGFKINTNNSGVIIDGCSFGVAANADSIKLMSVGGIDITNNFLLGDGSLACISGSPNPGRPRSGVYIAGGHGIIRVINNQSEGLQYFLLNDANAPGTIRIYSNLILCRILINQNCRMSFGDNDTVAQVFRYGVGATDPRIHNMGGNTFVTYDGTTPVNDCGVEVSPGTLELTRTGFICPNFGDSIHVSIPALDMSTHFDDQIAIRIGNDDYYYDFKRQSSDGALVIAGNQTGQEKIDFNGWFVGTRFIPSKTVVTAGDTSVQTINKQTGRINIAAGQSSKVLNNNLVTANSTVIATVMTNDATAKSVQAVAGTGTITFYPNANPTGEIKVSFWVVT